MSLILKGNLILFLSCSFSFLLPLSFFSFLRARLLNATVIERKSNSFFFFSYLLFTFFCFTFLVFYPYSSSSFISSSFVLLLPTPPAFPLPNSPPHPLTPIPPTLHPFPNPQRDRQTESRQTQSKTNRQTHGRHVRRNIQCARNRTYKQTFSNSSPKG